MSTPSTGSSTPGSTSTAQRGSFFDRLYTGNGAFDIVGHRKRWYAIFGGLMLICLISMVFRGFNLGIDFEGGTRLSMPAQNEAGQVITVEQVEDVFSRAAGRDASSVQSVGTGASATMQIKAETLTNDEVGRVKAALANDLKPKSATGGTGVGQVSDSAVSGTWGGEISRQALIALGVFIVLVAIFLALYFEKWMAVAALGALVHDIVVTAGVYSLIGLEVTPATVIGLLTILGFSLYDTVVVFDKVKENTRGLLGLTRRSYPEAANLALNQTLMRSINTSLIALLPVIGLLIVGVWVLGVGTLEDLALVQLTGMLAGVLSSIFLATPILVDLKMREPQFAQQARKVQARRELQAKRAAAGVTDGEDEAEETGREKAMAGGVPGRTPKASDARRVAANTRPSGKSGGRPSGKKRR
ncbi:protein translocase subunit SecF [Actinokineospora bangkokensis]|uniref:Protein-export membrane protein SecF n=1 Tax=Actinokineospora bangkokensis TaxID=1193682 RepID=A0A1Q9LSB4_9PSEU|nr:protein translocase subunit SecF [Actinokineospora bangkokensis]OLR94908.1 protein-export membrane protein SecF [Actinokineospora bangkokensis]